MRQEISLEVKREEVSGSGGEISETSKKSNVFHYTGMLVRSKKKAVYCGKLTEVSAIMSWLVC